MIRYASYQDYIKKNPELSTSSGKEKIIANQLEKKPLIKDGYQVDIEKKQISKENAETKSKPKKPSVKKELVSKIVDGVKNGLINNAKQAVDIIPNLNNLPEKIIKDITSSSVDKKTDQTVDAPGIFFISGWKFKNLSSDDDSGLKIMSKYIDYSKHFNWTQKDELLNEILKRPIDRPIMLIGHSLGGDLGVEIANELNSLKYGFRPIELLVTLDSVGFDNDIIPQNVKKNMNFIGEKDYLYNDGPNIAKDNSNTNVVNELRSESHTQLDDAADIQFKIFNMINETLLSSVRSRFVNSDLVAHFID